MRSTDTSVDAYLKALPPDRREVIEAVRRTILENLDAGYMETMQYGMIGYCVPHSVYPPGYHCDPRQPLPFAGLASQKNAMSLYLMGVYLSASTQREFREAWLKSGKKLDMGSSCVRFKRLDDVPLDVVGRTIRSMPAKAYIAQYEAALGQRRTQVESRAGASKPGTTKKTAPKPARTAKKKVAKQAVRKATKKASPKAPKKPVAGSGKGSTRSRG